MALIKFRLFCHALVDLSDVVPILGSRNKERIIENLSTHEIVLTDEEFTALDEDLSKIAIYGSRNGVGFNTKYID